MKAYKLPKGHMLHNWYNRRKVAQRMIREAHLAGHTLIDCTDLGQPQHRIYFIIGKGDQYVSVIVGHIAFPYMSIIPRPGQGNSYRLDVHCADLAQFERAYTNAMGELVCQD